MITVSQIGRGFVGNSLFQTFKDYVHMESYDIKPELSTTKSITELCSKSEVIMLSLPTPIYPETGDINLTIIEKALQEVSDANKNNIVVIRSSVKPGSTRKFSEIYKNIRFVFNPEFLREETALEDFRNQTRIILGGERKNTEVVEKVYRQVFKEVPIFHTDFTTAEMTKFVINCFLACKVSFFNEMYQICDKLEIKYDDVKELAKKDERLGNSHLNVPNSVFGGTPKFGYGLSCLPCNTNILKSLGESLGIDCKMLKATIEKNDEVRPEKDWLSLEGRTVIKK